MYTEYRYISSCVHCHPNSSNMKSSGIQQMAQKDEADPTVALPLFYLNFYLKFDRLCECFVLQMCLVCLNRPHM